MELHVRELLNKSLHKHFNLCYHERSTTVHGAFNLCQYCTTLAPFNNRDFTTPEGFFDLWERASTQEWWCLFLHMHGCHDAEVLYTPKHLMRLIDPERFAIMMEVYLTSKGTEK